VQLRGAHLAVAGQAEREPADERLARLAAVAGEADELAAAERHDPFERPLDAALRHAEVLRDLRPTAAVAVQRDDLALALG
jgi:hypothetical protein